MKPPTLIPYLTLSAITLLSGCASIVSDSTYPVLIDSFPPEKSFVVKDENGKKVFSGKTPQTVMLDAGDGFFDGQLTRSSLLPETRY